MKQKKRDHIRSCGHVLSFLSDSRTLSKGELIQSAETIFTDYSLDGVLFIRIGKLCYLWPIPNTLTITK